MKSKLTTYPNFTALPRGLKMLLLASESYFFEEAARPLTPMAPVTFSISHRLLQQRESHSNVLRGVSIN